MANYISKFDQLHESAFSRYTQGAGFLAGDVVKFKKKVFKSEWFLSKPSTVQDLIRQMAESPNNLRVGYMKSEHPTNIGAYAASDAPMEMADIYMEISPANWLYPMTVPLNMLERVDTGANVAPIPDHLKDKNRTQIKGGKKEKGVAKETKGDDSNRQLPVSNTAIKGGKKWDDSKVGGGNLGTMPGTAMKESVSLETVYGYIVKEQVEPGSATTLIESLSEESDYDQSDVKTTGSGVTVNFKDSVYDSTVDDEIPVTVVAELSQATEDFASGYVVDSLIATKENGREVHLDPKDVEYLQNRAIDFAQKKSAPVVTEDGGKTTSVQVGKHNISRTRRNTGGADPTIMQTFTFDNGYSIVEFFGDYELKASNGDRIAYVHSSSQLNPYLHRVGLPIMDDIDAAFENAETADREGAEMDDLMGDIHP